MITYGEWGVEVRESPVSGLGCFASRAFEAGEVVEVAPTMVVDSDDLKSSLIQDIAHGSTHKNEGSYLLLGYGSLYNHSESPNIDRIINDKERAIAFYAIREIQEGEELLIHYGDRYWNDR